MTGQLHLAPERPADAPLADALIARAFGPGRYAKAAERLREGSSPIAGLSFVAWTRGRAAGCVRLWPIVIGGAPAVLLGPIAVDEAERNAGVGAALIQRACDAARAAGHALVLLVGDEPYFGQFGFARALHVRMPGPVDLRRVLVRALVSGAAEGLEGAVRAAPSERIAPALALAAE
ncbi:MAG: GNAT family N-acetyltransferase [Caulobacteraceae bacterium]